MTCTYTPPAGDFSTFGTRGTGHYYRRYPDGTEYRFGGDGRLVDVTDRFGSQTVYTHRYDAAWGGTRLQAITDPAGQVTAFDYWEPNAYGWQPGGLERIDAPGGRSTVYAVRADNNNLDHYRDPAYNVVALLGYDGQHRLTQVQDANGGVWNYEYDPNNASLARMLAPAVSVNGETAVRPETRVQAPLGAVFEYERSQGGMNWYYPVPTLQDRRGYVQDPNGNRTYYTTNEYGQALVDLSPGSRSAA